MLEIARCRRDLYEQAAETAKNRSLKMAYRALAKDSVPAVNAAIDRIKAAGHPTRETIFSLRWLFDPHGVPAAPTLSNHPSENIGLLYFLPVTYFAYVLRKRPDVAYRLADSLLSSLRSSERRRGKKSIGRKRVREFLKKTSPRLLVAYT